MVQSGGESALVKDTKRIATEIIEPMRPADTVVDISGHDVQWVQEKDRDGADNAHRSLYLTRPIPCDDSFEMGDQAQCYSAIRMLPDKRGSGESGMTYVSHGTAVKDGPDGTLRMIKIDRWVGHGCDSANNLLIGAAAGDVRGYTFEKSLEIGTRGFLGLLGPSFNPVSESMTYSGGVEASYDVWNPDPSVQGRVGFSVGYESVAGSIEMQNGKTEVERYEGVDLTASAEARFNLSTFDFVSPLFVSIEPLRAGVLVGPNKFKIGGALGAGYQITNRLSAKILMAYDVVFDSGIERPFGPEVKIFYRF